jgi:hypothetical protein
MAGLCDEMLRDAVSALRECRDPAFADELAGLLYWATPEKRLDPAQLGELVALAPASSDMLAVRAAHDTDHAEDLVKALERGLRVIDKHAAIARLAWEPAKIRSRARTLLLAGKATEAALLLDKATDQKLRDLASDVRAATTEEERQRVAKQLQ